MDCGAGIRDPDEDDLVSAGLQFAGQGDHRIEVASERHTNKANFHFRSFSILVVSRVRGSN